MGQGDANRRPVIVGRNVDHRHVAADAALRPVRLVDHDGAAVDNLTDDRDMAQRHASVGAEIQDAAGFLAAPRA
jgi:hypothetical protein